MPQLPEGTDHIVPGAAATSRRDDAPTVSTTDNSATATPAPAGDIRERAQAKAEELRGQATDKVRDVAEQGKARATGALDDLAKMLTDNAVQIDDKVGAQYGDYARRAADYVAGVSDSIRDKEVEELLDDARELVRRAPGLAVGGAAAFGFLLARVLKAGGDALEAGAAEIERSRPTGA